MGTELDVVGAVNVLVFLFWSYALCSGVLELLVCTWCAWLVICIISRWWPGAGHDASLEAK